MKMNKLKRSSTRSAPGVYNGEVDGCDPELVKAFSNEANHVNEGVLTLYSR